jgi:hypothetical protein
MTDITDYTRHEAVLKALGWKRHEYCQPTDGCYWRDSTGKLRIFSIDDIPPTIQELWEGLCEACTDTVYHPRLYGMTHVLLETYNQNIHGHEAVSFLVEYYGTLDNTIAAALYTVLQQGGKHEG